MTTMELAEILGKMYGEAPKGEAVAMIHLFGIKHAQDIRDAGASIDDIVHAAGLKPSYRTEVQKGVNLAKYVQPR
jgi:calcineurin-like phosphoesterase family protein